MPKTLTRHRRHHRQSNISNPVAAAIARANMAAQMRDFAIAIYLANDGQPERETLAHLGWLIGLGAEMAAQTQPGSPLAKQLHAALRTVLQMSADGARWQSAQAGILEQAAQSAQRLALNHASMAERLVPDADWIANRIRAGTATVGDVAGAEVYAERKAA